MSSDNTADAGGARNAKARNHRGAAARHRQKLKEQGLKRVEVWVPENRVFDIRYIAAQMTSGAIVAASPPVHIPSGQTKTEDTMTTINAAWTISSLKEALENNDLLEAGEFGVELIPGGVHDPVLCVTVEALGNLPVYLAVQPDQILTTTPLWPCKDQQDPASFEAMMLRAHKVHLPLCALSIDVLDGEEWYELFGSMSSRSTLDSVITEIRAVSAAAIELAADIGPRKMVS